MGAYEHLLTQRDVKDVSNLGWVRPVDVSQEQMPESMVRQVPDEVERAWKQLVRALDPMPKTICTKLLEPLRQTSHKLNGIQNMRKQVYLNGEKDVAEGRPQRRTPPATQSGRLACHRVRVERLDGNTSTSGRHERRSALRGQSNVTPVHVIPEMPNMSLLSKSMLASRAVSYSQNYPMMLPLRVLKKMTCFALGHWASTK